MLDVAVEDCGITQIPFPTLNNMWNKAERLVQADGAILKVPWSPDAKARLVMSSSSEHPHLVKAQGDKYSCDDKCIMFKGFSLCSHVIAAAQHNGDLQSFLESQQGRCRPNLTAIGNLGMPAGAGRKGGVVKRKRSREPTPIETCSVRPCIKPKPSHGASSLISTQTSSLPLDNSRISPLATQRSFQAVPMTNVSNSAFQQSLPQLPLSPSPSSVVAHTSSIGMIVGTCVNVTAGRTPVTTLPSPVNSATHPVFAGSKAPFILKLKTKQMRVCQACRRDYEGVNDTMQLVVARAERRMVTNLVTGTQFLGREGNSHYHARETGLKQVCPQFRGADLIIPEDLKSSLTSYQKLYLITCLNVPIQC